MVLIKRVGIILLKALLGAGSKMPRENALVCESQFASQLVVQKHIDRPMQGNRTGSFFPFGCFQHFLTLFGVSSLYLRVTGTLSRTPIFMYHGHKPTSTSGVEQKQQRDIKEVRHQDMLNLTAQKHIPPK